MAPKLSSDRRALGISGTQFGRDASAGREVLLVVSGIEEGKLEKTRREERGSEPSDGVERTGGVKVGGGRGV